ncbi:DUF3027 domain-containing protein [Angustibacter sp. McL0619]|uniref:DUF3027 domain-containing protein n=1 Tax=Angustibacter sp. McL0619 TaxID=3415676 RepID=UPI003CE7CF0F
MPTPTDTVAVVAVEPEAAAARRGRAAPVDAVLADAVDLARQAALEVAEPGAVGEHLGISADGERLLSHAFACSSMGYRGWQWVVTFSRAPRSRAVTVSEVNLLPGDEALLSPQWLPWSDRLAPGDLSAGDVLPKRVDDPNLELGYQATGDEDADQLALWELGLGRPRVLSLLGREDAAQRWYEGSHGPDDPHAQQAPAKCTTCGYLVPMAGALRQVFGVCANEWSPSDGSVVSLDHGCGAHSEVDVEQRSEVVELPVLDELGYESVEIERRTAEPEQAEQPEDDSTE